MVKIIQTNGINLLSKVLEHRKNMSACLKFVCLWLELRKKTSVELLFRLLIDCHHLLSLNILLKSYHLVYYNTFPVNICIPIGECASWNPPRREVIKWASVLGQCSCQFAVLTRFDLYNLAHKVFPGTSRFQFWILVNIQYTPCRFPPRKGKKSDIVTIFN